LRDPGRLPVLLGEATALLARSRADVDVGSVREPLTRAELDCLRLLATDLSQREIGAQLYVSHNTVKTHTRNIYRKLGATSREDAVARAAASGLLDSAEASEPPV
jgi:DNA-binding CsgD family transcriptional regulator